MKYTITFFLALIITSGMSQNRPLGKVYSYEPMASHAASYLSKPNWPHFFTKDRQQIMRPKSLVYMTQASSASINGENYWMGTMTTQSYNKGKLGTYYFWDVQGNLRESRMFLDIAGKNKRGLKLVFPRR